MLWAVTIGSNRKLCKLLFCCAVIRWLDCTHLIVARAQACNTAYFSACRLLPDEVPKYDPRSLTQTGCRVSQQKTQKVLIVTNMGPKPGAPFQGQFVKNQVEALSAIHPAYCYMRWHNNSVLNKLLKYPVLWLQFVWCYLFSRTRYDIIHVHYFYPTIWLALTYRWLRNPKVKIVVTCHGSDIYLYKPEPWLYKFAAARVQHFIFTSEKLRQKFFCRPESSEVLPAGIHPVFGQATQKNFADKPIDLLYVGTLDLNKGMDRLLALLPNLTQYQIRIVGEGPYRAQLAEAAKQYTNLQLCDPVGPAELQQYFENSKCFLSLSRNESFGLVMTEAMACYTPVIATETDGSLAQIEHGRTGYCLAQQDETKLLQQLHHTIQHLLSLPASEYLQLQAAGRVNAEQYLISKVADKLLNLYQRL